MTLILFKLELHGQQLRRRAPKIIHHAQSLILVEHLIHGTRLLSLHLAHSVQINRLVFVLALRSILG